MGSICSQNNSVTEPADVQKSQSADGKVEDQANTTTPPKPVTPERKQIGPVFGRPMEDIKATYKMGKDENTPLKATDFGLSAFFKQGDTFRDIVGSAYYIALEVLKRKYGPEVDI